MEVKNLKDLKSVMTICKKLGVKTIEVGGVKMEFSDEALRAKPKKTKMANELDLTPQQEYSPEDLMFWSSN